MEAANDRIMNTWRVLLVNRPPHFEFALARDPAYDGVCGRPPISSHQPIARWRRPECKRGPTPSG